MSGPAGGHPREVLSAYLDDELAVEERMTVDRHLAECEDCRSQLAALEQLARAVRGEAVPAVPTDLLERVGRRVDAAAVLRPRRFRVALPATIAATIAALGILVALQWREGGLMRPVMPEPRSNPVPEGRFYQNRPSEAPAVDTEEGAKRDDLREKDAKAKAAPDVGPLPSPEPKEEDLAGGTPEGVGGGAPGGVVGGVVGGVEGGVEGSAPAAAPPPPAMRAVAPMEPAPLARSVAASPCGERWTDSGVRGTWDVADAAKAARELDRIARDLAGRGTWRGIADGRPYQLVVPRARFDEVFFALRARGVSGLDELPAPAPGDDCLALSIAINER